MTRSEHNRRRRRLAAAMPAGSIALLPAADELLRNRDVHFPFRQDSDFTYLTGFPEPEAMAILAPGRKEGELVLFLPAAGPGEGAVGRNARRCGGRGCRLRRRPGTPSRRAGRGPAQAAGELRTGLLPAGSAPGARPAPDGLDQGGARQGQVGRERADRAGLPG